MLRSRSRVFALRFDKLATTQELECGLHGAFGKAGGFRKHAQAGRHRFPSRARGLAVKIEVNQIRGRWAIVPQDIAHQDIEHVIVDRNGFAAAGHELNLEARKPGRG